MNARRTLFLGALLGLTAAALPAQVGKPLPKAKLVDFAQTRATSLQDFKGRLLLVEFFAYW